VPDETKADPAAVVADLAATMQRLRAILFEPAKPDAKADRIVRLQSRHVVAQALIAEFLTRWGSDDVAQRLLELADAISGLRNGTVADLVRPSTPYSRPPDGIVPWSYRHEVVIGLECILRSKKKTLKEAARYIAKKYPALERLKRNAKDNLEGAIRSWRANIRAGKTPIGEAALAHEHRFFEGLGKLSANEMFRRGEQCLAAITETLVTHEF
jgi:hypothetical protein